MEGAMGKRPKLSNDGKINKDRLTELPRPLLDQILSYLPMDDVIKTSVLAKRWRNIWLTVPCLRFPYKKKRIEEAITSVNSSLILYEGLKIQKLDISLKCINSKSAKNVDRWLRFALTHDVNELCLEFCGGNFWYGLPKSVLRSRLLTCLTLSGCSLSMPAGCELNSLRILKLEEVILSGNDLNSLVSACPVLQELFLTNSLPLQSVELCIMNVAVKTLKIYDGYNRSLDSTLTFNAPHIISLELITECCWGECYSIKKMISLESAIFDSGNQHCPSFTQCAIKCKNAIGEMIESICHVKDLRLNSCILLALSISGEKLVGSLSFSITSLVIRSWMMKQELPGIAYILRHSPNIKTFIINVEKLSCLEEYNPGDLGYWKLQEGDGIYMLQNLKTVEVYNFMNNLNMAPLKLYCASIEELLQRLGTDLEFLRFLLNNAKVLESLIIKTCDLAIDKTKKTGLLNSLTKELQGYHRASQVAEVKIDFDAQQVS